MGLRVFPGHETSDLKTKKFQADRDELVTLEPELQVLSNSREDKRALWAPPKTFCSQKVPVGLRERPKSQMLIEESFLGSSLLLWLLTCIPTLHLFPFCTPSSLSHCPWSTDADDIC